MNRVKYLAWVLLILSTLGSCSALNRPRMLQPDMEVNRIFETNTVLPDHVYYYTGPQDRPDAIIAVNRAYQMRESVHWIRIDMTEKQLRDWNVVIDNDRRVYFTYNGYYILTPDGKQAGVFYSKYDFTVIKYPAPNQIVIYPPDPTPEQQMRLRRHGGF